MRIRLPLLALPLRARRFRPICCLSLFSWVDRSRSFRMGTSARRTWATKVVPFLDKHDALLLANHGAVTMDLAR